MYLTADIQLFLLSVEEFCNILTFDIPIKHLEQLVKTL